MQVVLWPGKTLCLESSERKNGHYCTHSFLNHCVVGTHNLNQWLLLCTDIYRTQIKRYMQVCNSTGLSHTWSQHPNMWMFVWLCSSLPSSPRPVPPQPQMWPLPPIPASPTRSLAPPSLWLTWSYSTLRKRSANCLAGTILVAVPDRTLILFCHVFRAHHWVWRAIALNFH